MKRLKYLKVLLLFFLIETNSAQQDVQFTHFNEYTQYYNPAYVAEARNLCADLLSRHQWTGMEGAPKSYYFDIRYATSNLHGGVGLSILKDELGVQKNTEVNGTYAYSIRFPKGRLHAGLSFGVKHVTWGTGYIPPETLLDNSIPVGGSSGAVFNTNAGIFYKGTNNLYMGLSLTNLNQPVYKAKQSVFNFQNVRHYYILAGYKKNISALWTIAPSVFAKTDAVSAQVDVCVKGVYNQRIYGAVNYRVMDAISPQIGMFFFAPNIKITASYSYDCTTSMVRKYSSGSHEIRLSACIKLDEIFPERYVDPRDLGRL